MVSFFENLVIYACIYICLALPASFRGAWSILVQFNVLPKTHVGFTAHKFQKSMTKQLNLFDWLLFYLSQYMLSGFVHIFS